MRTDRRLRSERGVAMVEFALVLPLLLLVLVGIFEFGRMFNYWIDSTHLANEGARWAVVDSAPNNTVQPDYNLQEYVCSQASTEEMQQGLAVSVQFSPTPEDKDTFTDSSAGLELGDAVLVKVTKTMSFPLVGGMLKILGGSGFGTIPISGKSTMRIETLPLSGTPDTFSGGTLACP